MNIEDVKQIPIADYLHSLGYSPVKQQGNGLWYKSPLREEHEPSFKVNTDRNLWYDFGAGKGGNIIALAKELYCSDSLPYLLNRIAEQTPHVRPVSFSFPQRRTEPSFQHLEVRDLIHPAFARCANWLMLLASPASLRMVSASCLFSRGMTSTETTACLTYSLTRNPASPARFLMA